MHDKAALSDGLTRKSNITAMDIQCGYSIGYHPATTLVTFSGVLCILQRRPSIISNRMFLCLGNNNMVYISSVYILPVIDDRVMNNIAFSNW